LAKTRAYSASHFIEDHPQIPNRTAKEFLDRHRFFEDVRLQQVENLLHVGQISNLPIHPWQATEKKGLLSRGKPLISFRRNSCSNKKLTAGVFVLLIEPNFVGWGSVKKSK